MLTLDSIVERLQQQFAPVAKEKGVAFPVEVEDESSRDAAYRYAARRTDSEEPALQRLQIYRKGSVTLEVHRPDTTDGIATRRRSITRSAIAFSVIDTGIGIEPSKFKDIFEAFQQEDGSIDRHYGGTGLGLTIARKFAHLLGGEIHVASQKGKGSRLHAGAAGELARAETEEMPRHRRHAAAGNCPHRAEGHAANVPWRSSSPTTAKYQRQR